jgi:hypothetical protein
MRFSLRNTHGATATADDWTCVIGGHLIPAGEQYVSVNYSRERWSGPRANTVTPDEIQDLFYACMQHAPSEDEVIAALRAAGIPVEG